MWNLKLGTIFQITFGFCPGTRTQASAGMPMKFLPILMRTGRSLILQVRALKVPLFSRDLFAQ